MLVVVLDNIRSAFNVGSIFRTSDSAKVDLICLCGISATPENIKVLKTSLGSEKSVPWRYFSTTHEAIDWLKKEGITIYAAEITPSAQKFDQIKYGSKSAIIFGHEKSGVGSEVLSNVDHHIYIPMAGIKKSLNVAVSAGIIIYEAARQLGKYE